LEHSVSRLIYSNKREQKLRFKLVDGVLCFLCVWMDDNNNNNDNNINNEQVSVIVTLSSKTSRSCYRKVMSVT